MANPYYAASGTPSTNAAATSATMRSEFSSIEAGFNLLPTLAGNGLKIVRVNTGASALEVVSVTGTGSVVMGTSPTITTPTFSGAITAPVGINMTPTFNLDVKGGAGLGVPAQRWEVDGGSGIKVELERHVGGDGTAVFGTQTNHNVSFKANDTSFLYLTADGRFYGTALHNNAGAVTGTANQYIASGTYTPTITNAANIAANTPNSTQWIRVGNVVHVAGTISITAASGFDWSFEASLPIASTLANTYNLGGAGASTASRVFVAGLVANHTAQFSSSGNTSVAAVAVSFTFTYLVL